MKMVERRRNIDEDADIYVAKAYKNKDKFQVARVVAVIGGLGLILGSVLLAASSNLELNRLQSKVALMQSSFNEQAVKMESRFKRSLENTRLMFERASENIHHLKKRQAEVTQLKETPPHNISTNFGDKNNECCVDFKAEFDGATFVRWGRRNCPENTSKLVYNGYAAGALFSHTGGVNNYMCLHKNITYTTGKYSNGNNGASYLYGLEFRDSSWVYRLFDLTLIETRALQYHSVPCSVCLANHANTELMIPGREDCPSGWVKQYVGYIMAGGHSDKHSSSPICVDERPQVVPGTQGSQGGAYLFMVETICTSLLCEPFVAGREVRCVVCTI